MGWQTKGTISLEMGARQNIDHKRWANLIIFVTLNRSWTGSVFAVYKQLGTNGKRPVKLSLLAALRRRIRMRWIRTVRNVLSTETRNRIYTRTTCTPGYTRETARGGWICYVEWWILTILLAFRGLRRTNGRRAVKTRERQRSKRFRKVYNNIP